MIAIIGTSDRPCWLAEACKILLLLLNDFDLCERKTGRCLCYDHADAITNRAARAKPFARTDVACLTTTDLSHSASHQVSPVFVLMDHQPDVFQAAKGLRVRLLTGTAV